MHCISFFVGKNDEGNLVAVCVTGPDGGKLAYAPPNLRTNPSSSSGSGVLWGHESARGRGRGRGECSLTPTVAVPCSMTLGHSVCSTRSTHTSHSHTRARACVHSSAGLVRVFVCFPPLFYCIVFDCCMQCWRPSAASLRHWVTAIEVPVSMDLSNEFEFMPPVLENLITMVSLVS